MSRLTLVTGARGFVADRLVRDLLADGIAVRSVDKKPLDDWYFSSAQAENLVAGLQVAHACGYAAIFARILASNPASRAITTSMALMELGMVAVKKRRRQSRAKWRWQ